MGTVRLLPLVAFAALCLFTLKTAGLVFSGGYVLSGTAPAVAQEPAESGDASKAKDAGASADTGDSADAGADAPKTAEGEKKASGDPVAEPAMAKKVDAGKTMPSGPGPAGPVTQENRSTTAVMESLSKRRKEIEAQAEQLKLRENLLKAAEKQVAVRITELKAIETRITSVLKEKDELESEQLLRLVKMYGGMKPKQAARIFDRLDMEVLTSLVKHMKARKMSAILAAMSPQRAEMLTLEIANKSKSARPDLSNLPKISSGDPG